MKILITGASGAISRLVASALSPRHTLVGLDPRPLEGQHRFPGEFEVVDYHSRKLDDVFRAHQFDAVLHLGRIRESLKYSAHYRFQMNVVGTQRLLSLCKESSVKKLIVLSTYHVYGAHRLNPLRLTEETPLRASQSFPELSDAVELDHSAATFMWKVRDVSTTILRPVNVIGRHVRNTICSLLRSGICPKIIGFDPLMQFIDERDLARALVLAMEKDQAGIFNVAGEGVIPLSHAIKHADAIPFPVPPFVTTGLMRGLEGVTKLGFPPYLMDYFKYPVVVGDDEFRKTFGYKPKIKTVESLRNLGQPESSQKIPKMVTPGEDGV